MSTISVSQYGVQSKLLELAATHFGDSDVLKTGLVGYLTEGMSLVHNDGMIHRITMYDEIFKNTAKLPTSINRYASWQKWEIPQASPSYTQVSIAFSYNDLKTKLDTYSQIKISRTDTLELGSFKFTVPYDVVITETDGTISAEYILSSNMTALSDTIQTKYTSNPYIQVATRSIADIDSSSTSTTKYVFFLLDFYQYELTEQVWEHYNATDAIDKAMYYDGAYSDQLIKFDILYNGTLIDKFYNLNETSTGMYAYYTYKEDGKLSVYFDNTATLKPVFGSTLTIQYSTGLGTEGNFTYSGTPYFKFNSTEYNDLNSVVTIVSQPSGGKDKMSLSEIRKYLAYLDLTRDSLTTEYDLENYFETLINELSTSSLQLSFYKKQDDIFRRLFYAFLLFKDSTGIIIPTNTVNISFPYSYLDAENNFIKAGTLFKYDKDTATVRLLGDSEFVEILTESHGNFYYMLPYSLKFNFEKFNNVQYINLHRNDSYSLNYVPLVNKSQFVTNVIANAMNLTRNPMNSSDYTLSVPYTLSDVTGINMLTDIKMNLTFYDSNSIARFSKSLDYNTETNKFEATITSQDRFNNLSEILLSNVVNLQTGETTSYISDSCYFVVETFQLYNNEWLPSTKYKSDTDEIFFSTMDTMFKSELLMDASSNIKVTDIPLIGARFGLNATNFSNFITYMKNIESITESSLSSIQNSTEIDVKFFNTYGISQDYTSPYTNISLTMEIKMKSSINDILITQIKQSIIDYIISLSTNGELISFSKIIVYLQKTYSSIDYIIPRGFNNIASYTSASDIIEASTAASTQQSINSFRDHPPEYININNVYQSGTGTDGLQLTFF